MTNQAEVWDDKRAIFESVKQSITDGVEEFEGFIDLESGRRGREGLPYEELLGTSSIPSIDAFKANIGRFVKFYPAVMQDVDTVIVHENGENETKTESMVDIDETNKVISAITNRLGRVYSTDEVPVSFSGKISNEHIYVKFNGVKKARASKPKETTTETTTTETTETVDEIVDFSTVPQ